MYGEHNHTSVDIAEELAKSHTLKEKRIITKPDKIMVRTENNANIIDVKVEFSKENKNSKGYWTKFISMKAAKKVGSGDSAFSISHTETYYANTDTKLKVDSKHKIDLDDYEIKDNDFEFTNDDGGVKTIIVRQLVPKGFL